MISYYSNILISEKNVFIWIYVLNKEFSFQTQMVEQCVRRTGVQLSLIDVLKKSVAAVAVARNLAETKSEDFVQYVAKQIAHQMESQHSSIDGQRRNAAVDVVLKSQVEIK